MSTQKNSGHKVLHVNSRGSFGGVKLSTIFADLLIPSGISVVFHPPHHHTLLFWNNSTQPKKYMFTG